MLAVLVVSVIACFSTTSCSKDEPNGDIIYTMGITQASSSSLEMLADLKIIYNAFYEAVGVEENTFTMKGNTADCDKKVKEACEKAALTLKDNIWKGSYTFTVTNVNTQKAIYQHTFSNDGNSTL